MAEVQSRQLERLGHVARMPDNRMPKASFVYCLAGCSPCMRSTTSVERRVAHRHFSAAGHARDRFKLVDRRCWREEIVNIGISPLPLTDSVICEVCSRSFRRSSDMKRHRCVAERRLPVPMQRRSRQCGTGVCACVRAWVRSLKVFHHHCISRVSLVSL